MVESAKVGDVLLFSGEYVIITGPPVGEAYHASFSVFQRNWENSQRRTFYLPEKWAEFVCHLPQEVVEKVHLLPRELLRLAIEEGKAISWDEFMNRGPWEE